MPIWSDPRFRQDADNEIYLYSPPDNGQALIYLHKIQASIHNSDSPVDGTHPVS